MGLGFAWDMAVGVFCDFAGTDRYEAARENVQGCGAQAGLGVLFDYEDKDEYGCGVENNSCNQRGSESGFLIDRPKQEERDKIVEGKDAKMTNNP